MELTDQNFAQFLKETGKPVLVDFWSPMCAPCLIMGSVIEEIEEEFGEKIMFGKLNISVNPEIAEEYKIMSIPTFIIFKDGQETERIIGAHPKQFLVDRINSLI